jgi:hypothetical protein
VLLNSVAQALHDGPELSTQAARMFASVSDRSNPSQLTFGAPPVQLASVAILSLQKLAGVPLTISGRFISAWLAALAKPAALLEGAPISCPVASVNWASAHSAATVVNSLSVTETGWATVFDIPATLISPIELLLPSPAFPPTAVR